jgi:Zn-dependent protease with chaperone function
MDVNELQFIIGHEMGHICLGHTWLNSLVGGMAGIPASAPSALLLVFALRWWNRACEYSADRAGLLACSKPEKAISALIKLEAAALGEGSFSQANLAKVLQRIEASDDHWTDSMEELLTTHPMMIKRINQIRLYSVSTEYQTLQKMVNTNLH